MDLTSLAVDAGQFINRAVQYTGETLGQAEKTELHSGLDELLSRAESTKTWTDQIISQTEILLEPRPGARLEDKVYGHLDWSIPPRPRDIETLGDHMTQAGMEMGSNTPYGTALLRCGEAQKQMGEAERKFAQSTCIHFLTPLRSFTDGEYRVIQDERRLLVNKRLDLDIAKTRLRKAHEAEAESTNLNSTPNPLADDYVGQVSYMFSFLRVKWLKVWAQEISQAEMELRICQSLFDRQSEITRQLLGGISNTHTNHMRSLIDFVEAQSCYYAQCYQHAQELQRQLSSIPAVFCSNNWQTATSNGINQPSTSSNRVANGPSQLNLKTPVPVIIYQPPGFNEPADMPGNEKPCSPESSLPTQQPDKANDNNSNNNSSSNRQLTTKCSESSLTSGEVSQSSATKHSTETIAGRCPTFNETASPHMISEESANEPPTTKETYSQSVSQNDMTIKLTSSELICPLTITGVMATGLQATSEMDSEMQTTSNTDGQSVTVNEIVGKPLPSSETASESLAISGSDTPLLVPYGTFNEPSTSKEVATPPLTNRTAIELKANNDISGKHLTPEGPVSLQSIVNRTVSSVSTVLETTNEPPTSRETAGEPVSPNDTMSDERSGEPQATNLENTKPSLSGSQSELQ